MTAPDIKFPKFRERTTDYEQSRMEWLEVFNRAASSPNAASEWEEWLRDPFLEGSPIFSRVNRRSKKGVVVNQILPSDDDLHFRAYLNVFAPDETDDRVGHLVVTCTLSEKSKILAGKLINAFIAGGTSDEIERQAIAQGSW